MMTGESPRMLFEVIMNRFENDYSPDIIYNASCKLKEYALNREPKRFMSIRVTSDRFHENNHKTCSSSFKTSSYPSLHNAPKHVSNLIVSCAEFQARPPSCSSPYSWEPLLCSSLTKISLPTKKNKQQVQNADPLFFYLFCLSCDICAHICEGICACFDFSYRNQLLKMCAHASICAWTCENQSKNIYACLDLRKSLHKFAL